MIKSVNIALIYIFSQKLNKIDFSDNSMGNEVLMINWVLVDPIMKILSIHFKLINFATKVNSKL